MFSLARHPVNAEPVGVKQIQADLDQPDSLTNLPTTDQIIYYFAPPPQQGEDDPRMKNFLGAISLAPLPERIVYISTTGVYGDCKGAWVTEESPVAPTTDRARRRLAAEQALRTWAQEHHIPCVILRISGIYGPGRLPLERLRQGMSVLRRDMAPYSNRIHADDLARVCEAAAAAPGDCAIYNVCDNESSTMSDYFIAVAQHAGLPLPEEIDWQQAEKELSPAMLSYLHESRRIDNSKMLRELNIKLAYPTLKEGLAACF